MFLSSRVTPWVGQLLDCVLTFLLKLPFARTILQGLLLPVLKLLIAVAQQVYTYLFVLQQACAGAC